MPAPTLASIVARKVDPRALATATASDPEVEAALRLADGWAAVYRAWERAGGGGDGEPKPLDLDLSARPLAVVEAAGMAWRGPPPALDTWAPERRDAWLRGAAVARGFMVGGPGGRGGPGGGPGPRAGGGARGASQALTRDAALAAACAPDTTGDPSRFDLDFSVPCGAVTCRACAIAAARAVVEGCGRGPRAATCVARALEGVDDPTTRAGLAYGAGLYTASPVAVGAVGALDPVAYAAGAASLAAGLDRPPGAAEFTRER
jgi:hypothetical protein